MTRKRDSTMQHMGPVPDLGAPKLEYIIVEFDDCDPPEYAVGIFVNGQRAGLLQDAVKRFITNRSKAILEMEAEIRGIPARPPEPEASVGTLSLVPARS